jgi:hypothetical protein
LSHRSQVIDHSRTLELLIDATTACDAERADELLELNGAILVFIEDVEDIVGEFAWVAEWKKLLIYSAEFSSVELTRWTVLDESFVPDAIVVD